MERTIASVIRKHFPDYASQHRLPLHQHRAASLISRCGRSELGGHLDRCPCTKTERIVWHSCKHRLCPRCALKGRDDWLARESERLLPCAHHHIIFTFPHELLSWWRFNRERMANALFESAAQTLLELLADPRYLGARPGLLLALHTWSRSLALHPHIHALVSDGGFANEAWLSPRRSHFLPAKVVKALFRGKLLAALSQLLSRNELRLPPDVSQERARTLINCLGRAKWHVWLCQRYAHGQGVLIYLARYLRGGPMRDAQLLRVTDSSLVIGYQPNNAPPTKMTLRTHDWLSRYLEHTPVQGQHSLRRYGLYAPASKEPLRLARALIPEPYEHIPPRYSIHPKPAPCCCPHCAQPLRFAFRLPPQRAPPP